MRKITQEEFTGILELHDKWLRDIEGGKRADFKECDLSEIKFEGANLEGANMWGANMWGANLEGANLEGANLEGANLEGANLEGANMRGANMWGANMWGANLEPIKKDMFDVLLRAIPEIPLLEKAILEGKVDGSTYEGKCACLCGTIEKSGRWNGSCDMRDPWRPIEKFFINIKKGDTPENNNYSKLAYEWLQEFKGYIGSVLTEEKSKAKGK